MQVFFDVGLGYAPNFLKAWSLSRLRAAGVAVIDFVSLEVAEWDPHLDMRISYRPMVEIRCTMSRMQGMTYRPRCLPMVCSSSVGGDICYLTHCVFVLTVC